MISYQETPIVEIHDPLIERSGVRLLIKREDMNHPFVSGNKWWKLKYNLEEALRLGHKTLLTFGGAYSNHIYATSAAAHELGLKSIGVIRGEESKVLNRTLAFVKGKGMRLHYVSREDYRKKSESLFVEALRERFGDFYLLPEGGTNSLAIQGCSEFAKVFLAPISFDYLCLPVGTGGTMAGIVKGLEDRRRVIGFSSLKVGSFLHTEVRNLLGTESNIRLDNWQIETDYHFGGYGKNTPALMEFISSAWKQHHLPLDPVYTAKMMFGIYDMIARGRIESSSTVLMLHTGGLQGNGSLSK